MIYPPNKQPSCFVCAGALTAVSPSINLEHASSFNRYWICDSCGAKYSEDVEIEKESAADKEATDNLDQETDHSPSKEETLVCPECKGDLASGSGSNGMVCEECGLTVEEDLIDSGPDWRKFNTDSESKQGLSSSRDWDDSRHPKVREEWEKDRIKQVGRKSHDLNNAEEMPVDWHAPFGAVLDQTDQFVVAQTLYKNRFALLDIRTGDLIAEVELVRDQSEAPAEEYNEWNPDQIPDDVVLNPSGNFKLETQPGWDPDEGVNWCVGHNALFTFDDNGVCRYSGSDGSLTWTIEALADEASEEQRCCTFLNGVLFVATSDVLWAIQVDTGDISWRYKLDDEDSDNLRLLPYSETLYLFDGFELVSLDVDSGTEKWVREIGGAHRDQTVTQFGGIQGDILLTVEESDTSYVCGYDVSSGEQRWAFQDRRGVSILQTHDDVVYVDGTDGVVLCLNVATGVLRWQHQFMKLVMDVYKARAQPDWGRIEYLTVTDQGVVTCNLAGTVYLLDMETGNKQWRNFPDGELPSDSGQEAVCRVVGDTVVRIKGTEVKAFDLSSGKEEWSFETTDIVVPTSISWGGPVVKDDVLYFTDYNGVIYEVSSEVNGLQRLSHSEDDDSRIFEVDAEHVYVTSLEPSADISANRITQEACTKRTDLQRSVDSLLNLQALLR